MADRELANVLNSGEVTNYQKGGTDIGDKLLSSDEIDTKLAPYAKTDGTTPVSLMRWTPTDPTTVSYVESTTYYNQYAGTFDIKGKYSDVTLQTGREVHIEVVNNTGVTITNGKPVRHNGVATATPPGGVPTPMPQITLAQADSFVNARILGVTTHDIPTGQTGLITSFGEVSGLDTSTFTVGVPLYLSSTVAGGITETPQDILSQIGGALTQDATTGRLFTSIENTINLPVAIGALGRNTVQVFSLNGTATNFDNFTAGDGVINTVTPASGIITITNAGWHEFTFSMSGSVDDEEEDIFFELYDATNATILGTRRINTGRSSTPSDVAFSPNFSTLIDIPMDNTSVLIRVRSDGTSLDLTVDTTQFYSKSIHIR